MTDVKIWNSLAMMNLQPVDYNETFVLIDQRLLTNGRGPRLSGHETHTANTSPWALHRPLGKVHEGWNRCQRRSVVGF
jgi:hypothetical protein